MNRLSLIFDKQNILKMFWAKEIARDSLIRLGTKSSMFGVKPTYRLTSEATSSASNWWTF